MFSKTAMTVERAAKIINKKKREPIILPPGIEVKIEESVVKRKLAPTVPASAVTLLLKVKQAGKMIRPDIMATKVSRHTIVVASLRSLLSFPI